MILSILLGLVTTWIIYSWGDLTFRFVPKYHKPESDFFLKYFTGFCILTVVANGVSVGVGLSNWLIQLLIWIPTFFLKYRKLFQKGALLKRIEAETALLAIFGLLIASSMHAWEIKHPDTITYQNQLIKYAKLGGHPIGIVQIKEQLGLGGSYYSIAALFSYPIIFDKTITLINLSLISVCIIYLSKIIGDSKHKTKPFLQITTLFVLGLCMYEYTFFRLAVNSVAPDTPAAIIGLATFFYHLNENKKIWILTLFSATAITMKLSLTPVLLLPFFNCIKYADVRQWAANLTIGILVFLPFATKNILSTGYLAYPVPYTRIIQSNYTPAGEDVQEIADYIKAYARTPSATREKNHLEKLVNMPMKDWGSRWLLEMPWSGRIMILSFIFGVCLMCWKATIYDRNNFEEIVYLSTTIFGIIFWMYLAPAIRFGSAFLLAPLFFLIHAMQINQIPAGRRNITRLAETLTLLFIIGLFGYLFYRMVYFMDCEATFIPKGPSI